MQLIKDIEAKTKSRLLVFITGDRRGRETRIAGDAFPFIYRLLTLIGERKDLNLFLYTTGGITIAGYGIVNIIREFVKEFTVIVPFKALSTGTLIALGANNIIMSKMGLLSPIDPSLQHPLGPTVELPGRPGVKAGVPINVEDVISYFELARDQASIKNEAHLAEVFKNLADKIHPLALGATNRARDQIKFLARTLLSYHMKDKQRINKIVSTLTKERFSHDYLIGRKEAQDVLSLNIVDAKEDLKESIMKLFNEYRDLLKLDIPYNPDAELGQNQSITAKYYRGIIESTDLTYVFITESEIKKVQVIQQGIPVDTPVERPLREEWVEDKPV